MTDSTSAGYMRPALVAALIGSALIIAGTFLPWMSLFAGLRKMNGFTGINGFILLGAAVSIASCVLLGGMRSSSLAIRVGTVIAFSTAVFSIWLTKGLLDVVSSGGRDAMLITRSGPGLFVVVGGAIIVFVSLMRTKPHRVVS